MTEHFETGSKKVGRGMAQRSLDLIEAMRVIAEAAQPITGRGVGYKLFTQRLIPSMSTGDMAKVYRLLRIAREQGDIPWEWIVDETRAVERVATWDDPADYARTVARSYRRDFWNQQPHRVQVWSEKGTVRGVLAPVLDQYAVGFFPVHGFTSATAAHDVAEDSDGRPLIILYVGDFDPSGMFMSDADLPIRFAKYDGDHIKLRRIALTRQQVRGLPSFPAADKRKDPRYRWFASNYGDRCWELDAMDPNDLRDCVKREIKKLIEPVAWRRCEIVNKAEQDSLRTILDGVGAAMTGNLNTIRAAFMRRASAPHVNPFALKLAYLIAYKYMNNETGTARPSQETLARDLGCDSVRTVQRMLDILRPLGLVVVPGHGPNRSSTYWIDPDKATPVSPINTTPVSPIGGRKGDTPRQKTRQPTTEKATPESPQLKKKNQEEEPRGGANAPPLWERERGSLTLTAPPGALAPDGGAPDLKKSYPSEQVITPGDRFTELLASWQRPWGDEDEAAARKAFAEACREADADQIIASARRWVAAFETDPEHLKPLEKWLAKGGWKNLPPSRKPKRNGGKAPLAEMMLKRGRS